MQALIVLCHPRGGSFCHALAERCRATCRDAGAAVTVQDLYADRFDPVMTEEELRRGFSFDDQVQRYGREVAAADLVVVIHPEWWGQPPALLKGWIDRVLRPGVAYELEQPTELTTRAVPLLSARRARVFCTTDNPESTGVLEQVWTRGVFEFCGLRDVAVRVLPGVRDSTYALRQTWLAETSRAVAEALTSSAP